MSLIAIKNIIKNYGLRIIECLLRTLIHLPLPLWQKCAYFIGTLVFHCRSKRTTIIKNNIDIAFPSLNHDEKEKLCKAIVINTILGFFESFFGWWGSEKKILQYSDVEGLDILQSAMAANTGVIILGAHFTTMELSARVMGVRKKVDAVYRQQNSHFFDCLIRDARQKYFNELILKTETRRIIKRLKEGAAIWIAIDQDAGRKSSVFPDFFGTPASTVSSIHKLTKLTGCKVLFYSHFRTGYGKETRFTGKFHSPMDFTHSLSPLETAQAITTQLENILTANDVSQYFWVHRRYKTRPCPKEKPLYQ